MQLELNLTRYTKNNKTGFFRHFLQKRHIKESVFPLMSEADKLVRKDKEKAEVLNNVFGPSALEISLPTSLEWIGYRSWRSKIPNCITEN